MAPSSRVARDRCRAAQPDPGNPNPPRIRHRLGGRSISPLSVPTVCPWAVRGLKSPSSCHLPLQEPPFPAPLQRPRAGAGISAEPPGCRGRALGCRHRHCHRAQLLHGTQWLRRQPHRPARAVGRHLPGDLYPRADNKPVAGLLRHETLPAPSPAAAVPWATRFAAAAPGGSQRALKTRVGSAPAAAPSSRAPEAGSAPQTPPPPSAGVPLCRTRLLLAWKKPQQPETRVSFSHLHSRHPPGCGEDSLPLYKLPLIII